MHMYLQHFFAFAFLFFSIKVSLIELYFFVVAYTAGKHAGLNESRPEDFIDVSNHHQFVC